MKDEEIDFLIQEATAARLTAYAPYSKFLVGAAVRTSSGATFRGCNVENISFGLTMCAERVAIGSAYVSGFKSYSAIAIVADSILPVVPCGACRQVLAELNPNLLIISATLGGIRQKILLDFLLPNPRQGILERST